MPQSIQERFRSLTARFSNFSQLSPNKQDALMAEAHDVITDDMSNDFENDTDYKKLYNAYMSQPKKVGGKVV